MPAEVARTVPASGVWAATDRGRLAPAWAATAVEQFLRIGLALRSFGVGLSLLLAALTAVILYRGWTGGGVPGWMFLSYILLIVSASVPSRVWFESDLARRPYHWALPVSRANGQLTIVGAGWVWLMLIVSAYLVWATVVYQVTHAAGPRSAMDAVWILQIPSNFTSYAVYYSAATMVYCLMSAPFVSARRPGTWLPWACLALIVALGLLSRTEWPLAHFVEYELLGQGRFGLVTALAGHRHPTSQAAPEFWAWLPAVGLWLAIAVGAVVGASLLHREAE